MTQMAEGVHVTGDGLDAEGFTLRAHRLEGELRKVVAGQDELVRDVVIALLAGGHVLLEGVPGLGKTVLVRSIGAALHMEFSRIQFTPDLMPSDIVGTMIIRDTPEGRGFVFAAGPIFSNVVLADEINRATPKTQSALLEAMQERTVTVGDATRALPDPFFVLATQNPIELEGTYPLPEAQLDRFLFKLLVPFPSDETLAEIVRRTTGRNPVTVSPVLSREEVRAMVDLARGVPIAEHVLDYAVRIISATHPDRSPLQDISKYVRYGASPRAVQAIVQSAKVRALLEGRFNVAFADIKAVAAAALRHRIFLGFEADAAGVTTDDLIAGVLDAVTDEPLVS